VASEGCSRGGGRGGDRSTGRFGVPLRRHATIATKYVTPKVITKSSIFCGQG